jgi:hypothetical protein
MGLLYEGLKIPHMEKYKPYVEKLAVFGCYSVAMVYILVGTMALLSFMGESEDAADEERMVGVIMDIPMGEVLIGIMVLGMAGYVTWRFFEAFTDPYDFGSSMKGYVKRIGIAASALGYVVIIIGAVQIIIEGQSNGEEDQQLIIGQIMSVPGGGWLVGIMGVVLVLVGLIQLKYVAGGDYHKRIKYEEMPSWIEKSTHILAWWGYLARGIILGILGWFLFRAAIESDPGEVGDTDSAFDFIGDMGMAGNIFFIAVAAGTIFYGLFMILNGYYYSFQRESKQFH